MEKTTCHGMSFLSLKICKLFRKRLSGHLSERVQRRMPHGKAGNQDELCPVHFQDAIPCDETGIKQGSVSFPCLSLCSLPLQTLSALFWLQPNDRRSCSPSVACHSRDLQRLVSVMAVLTRGQTQRVLGFVPTLLKPPNQSIWNWTLLLPK